MLKKTMGNNLSQPNTDIVSEDFKINGYRILSSKMQGWRNSMEDKNHVITSIQWVNSGPAMLSGVLDGHGGVESSNFVANHVRFVEEALNKK